MDIYVKPKKTYKAENKRVVKLKDVADVFSSNGNPDKYNEIILMNISSQKRENFLITIIDIVKAITNVEPNATVSNIGETDIVIQFAPNPKKPNKTIDFIKTAVISIIIFFGASSAIMSFHADADIPKILEGYYEMFYEDDKIPYIVEVPYSIGLAMGILVFFNHFSKIQLSLDPTPIEVQMTTYEKEVIESQIDELDREKEQGQ